MEQKTFTRELLAGMGMSTYALASVLGVSYLNLLKIVNGKSLPRLPLARAIAGALGLGLDQVKFLSEDAPVCPPQS